MFMRKIGVSPFADLMAFYKLDGNTTDELGVNDGVGTDLTYETEVVGESAVFNNSTSKIVIPDSSTFIFGDGVSDTPFSVSFLMKLDVDNTTSNYFVSKSRDNVNREFLCSYSSTDILRFWLWNSNNTARILAGATWVKTLSQWHHIAYTYDGSKSFSGIKIYADGVSKTTVDSSSGTYTGITNTPSDIWIGQMESFQTPKMGGNLKNIKIWKKELTAAEVLAESVAQLLEV